MLSLKEIKELTRSAKARKESGLFAAEGRRLCEEAPKGSILQMVLSESFARSQIEIECACPCEVIRDTRFAGLCDTKTPQGILTILQKPLWRAEDVLRSENPLAVLLENLQDPGNAGTILRTAEAAGADAVLVTEDTVDLFSPKAVRATMGSIFRLPQLVFPDAGAALTFLREKKIKTYAAVPDAADNYSRQNYRDGSAFLIGNEGAGLTTETLARTDARIRIPMRGQVESLNAAMAAGVLLYEAARQRGGG